MSLTFLSWVEDPSDANLPSFLLYFLQVRSSQQARKSIKNIFSFLRKSANIRIMEASYEMTRTEDINNEHRKNIENAVCILNFKAQNIDKFFIKSKIISDNYLK